MTDPLIQDAGLNGEKPQLNTHKNNIRIDSGLTQPIDRAISPNAIERNVMRNIERELFENQKRNEHSC